MPSYFWVLFFYILLTNIGNLICSIIYEKKFNEIDQELDKKLDKKD